MNKAIIEAGTGRIKLILISDGEGSLQRATATTGEMDVPMTDENVVSYIKYSGEYRYNFKAEQFEKAILEVAPKTEEVSATGKKSKKEK